VVKNNNNGRSELFIMIKLKSRKDLRFKRQVRLRSKISGSSEQPRLCIFVSNKYIYVQIIDDIKGHTLVAASTKEKNFDMDNKKNIAAAERLGEIIAQRALENRVKKIVFDRSGYKYHGRVMAIAEAMRKLGLVF